jgi:hypothetical protein
MRVVPLHAAYASMLRWCVYIQTARQTPTAAEIATETETGTETSTRTRQTLSTDLEFETGLMLLVGEHRERFVEEIEEELRVKLLRDIVEAWRVRAGLGSRVSGLGVGVQSSGYTV